MKTEFEDEPSSGFKRRKNKAKIWGFLIILDLAITSMTAMAYFSSTRNAKPEPVISDYGELIAFFNGTRKLT